MRNNYLGIIVLNVLVVPLIILGFFVVGSPSTQKAVQLDRTKMTDFNQIDSIVQSYYVKNKTLPSAINQIKDFYPHINIQDPDTHADYKYKVTSPTTYKLCTTFALESKGDGADLYYEAKSHKKGNDCIPYTLDKYTLESENNDSNNPRDAIDSREVTRTEIVSYEVVPSAAVCPESAFQKGSNGTRDMCTYNGCSYTYSKNDFFAKGNAIDKDGKVYEDTCSGGSNKNIIKYYCAPDPNNAQSYIPKMLVHQCLYGCRDGSCTLR